MTKDEFNTPPPFKVCPECGGAGCFQDGPEPEDGYDCKNCYGTGRIPIYYTVEKWENETGRKVPDDMPVWVKGHGLIEFDYVRGIHKGITVIATEAGRPPKDWRPE